MALVDGTTEGANGVIADAPAAIEEFIAKRDEL
jgi:hypothetical protein